MPPQFLFDLSAVDLNNLIWDQMAIRECNPQRGAMEHLNGIIYINEPSGDILGFKDVTDKEFWVEGHIPGRPLLPGVIMIEAAAQLASFYTKRLLGWSGFIGFGGVENCKFRMPVMPGCRMLILVKKLAERHRRITCAAQGVVNGQLVFEANIIGTQV